MDGHMARIKVTAEAQRALLEAAARNDGAPLRLAIDDRFDHELYFDERTPNDEDVHCGGGVTLIVDALTAQRADGMVIDFVEHGEVRGFRIDNPNAPPKVKSLAAAELREMLARDPGLELVDVRTPEERAIARLPNSRLLDQSYFDELLTRDPNAALVFYCHHGIRSQAAAEQLAGRGFRNIYNLSGGIDAWSLLCDPAMPRY
jgi:monothiol glutaredoxin